ncbi:Hypothetical predicted protein [Paramuricea clavata]|uniref:Uncharacterized protein n=1 Tax=Paramuricea clavata TaxID=317549 RepID=A0A6S7J1J9_PARCT|nr:Hypothetical predicted protein [Paramuricea clavata]
MFNLEQHIVPSVQNEVEARVIGIGESEATQKQRDDQIQEQQFIKDGFCHWGINDWHKPGSHVKCGCLKCTCDLGGNWNCSFFFKYCPYFYCGNEIYNPSTELCCCGKIYSKREDFQCCGYFYYNTKTSRCCNFYSVKPVKTVCPKYRV